MKTLKLTTLLLALTVINLVSAQQGSSQKELSLDGGTIDDQFEYVFKRSGNYSAEGRRYEVVRLQDLNKLRKNVNDTLVKVSKTEAQLQATIEQHETSITSLEKQLESTNTELNAVNEEKDSISLLGAMVSKGTYNFILWTIIIGLFLLLLLFIYRFRKSNYLTQEAKVKLADVEVEYENHRRRALEREQKISRQLQDEINKYKKSSR